MLSLWLRGVSHSQRPMTHADAATFRAPCSCTVLRHCRLLFGGRNGRLVIFQDGLDALSARMLGVSLA